VEIIVLAAAVVVAGIAIAVALARRTSPSAASDALDLAGALGGLRGELQALNARSETIQRDNAALRGEVTALQLSLQTTGTVASGLREATEAIRGELGKAAEGIARLREAGLARQQLEQTTADAIRRLESVLAGSSSRGVAGENLVEMVFSRLPVEWQLRDFHVNNKTVEFALRLPNGRVLPIDCKWPATGLLDEFAAAETPEAALRVRTRIESTVRDKAREVQRYLDLDLTHAFGVAVVPDAVYELCGEARAEAFARNVVLVSFSLFVPYLLLVYHTVLASTRDVDLERLTRVLREAQQHLAALAEEIEGRLSRSITMLTNSRDDLRGRVSKLSAGLGSVQVMASAPADVLASRSAEVEAR